MSPYNNQRGKRSRIDFEVFSGNEPGKVYFVLNRRRYAPIKKGDEVVAYKDKKTDELIPIDQLESFIKESLVSQEREGNFIQSFDSLKQAACSFLRECKSQLVQHWDEPYELGEIDLPLFKILAELRGQETQIVILYVDMAGSTVVSRSVDKLTNIKINKIFHMLMSQIIAKFGGFVYKTVGDEVIGVFPAGRFIVASDNAIQAAMTIRGAVVDVLNPLFDEKELPKIGFHIGLDIVEATVVPLGAQGIAATDDLISHQMNVAGKIAKLANRDEILLGRNLFEVIFTDWQDECEKLTINQQWLEDPDRRGTYQVYKLKAKWFCPESHAAE